MRRSKQFDELSEAYDSWYERHRSEYLSELGCVRSAVPASGFGLEVGVGTGRFAAPLGIRVGIDPSGEMLVFARRRGVESVRAVGETIPFADNVFDYLLLVVTICFVDDPSAVIAEAGRVLRPGGTILVGIIDRESSLGRLYLRKKDKSPFYRSARFFSVSEVLDLFPEDGWTDFGFRQTLFAGEPESEKVQESRDGYGDGSFVAITARKI